MSVGKEGQHDPEFIPVMSLPWLVRAVEAAGASGALVAMTAWREWALSHYRKKGRKDTPGFVKLTHRRVCERFGLDPKTFRRALGNLAAAGLVEVTRPSANSAHQVKIIPLPGEEYWTYSRLGAPAEARAYTKPPPKRQNRKP